MIFPHDTTIPLHPPFTSPKSFFGVFWGAPAISLREIRGTPAGYPQSGYAGSF